tara:strand:- start:267 stop:386 length:120 start_codon:yes stop_codon:yes gene_type:complete
LNSGELFKGEEGDGRETQGDAVSINKGEGVRRGGCEMKW